MNEDAKTPTTRFAPGRGTKLLIIALPTLLVAAVLCGIGEIAVRYHERHRTVVPGSMPELYYRHATLGHALVHSYDYYGWAHTNAQGFRGVRPVTTEKPAGTTRIMAVGGSTTFDILVSADSAAWPARLERMLNDLLPGHRVEVINAGVAAYAVDQDLIRLATELFEYHPDLIIFYHGHNDLFYSLGNAAGVNPAPDPQRPGEVATVTPWMHWLEAHSLLYAKLRAFFTSVRFSHSRGRSDQRMAAGARSLIEPSAQAFERRLRNYFAVARALGIPVVVPEVVQVSGASGHETDPARLAEWQHAIPFAPTDSVLAGYLRYNAALRSITKEYGIPFIPMLGLGIADTSYYFHGDPIHFSDRGADRFARGLAAQLVERHLIPVAGAPEEHALAAPAATAVGLAHASR
jgi:lysophospholipase L1-like esterase